MAELIECRDEDHYRALRTKVDDYETACIKLYGPEKRAFTPQEIIAVGKPNPTNEERSAVETWEFQHSQPDRYFAYVDVKSRLITTWMGQTLGRITQRGNPWHDNFGGYRASMEVLGINGVVYHGYYFASAGNYCRLKARRHKGSIVCRAT